MKNFIKKSMGSRDEKISIIFSLNWQCKKIRKIVFHPAVPVLKYHQKSSNSCCFSSLASDFHSIGENRAATALSNHIKEYLKLQIWIFRNKIDSADDMSKNKFLHKGEQRLRYNMKRQKKRMLLICKKYEWKCYFGVVNGLTTKCESCYQYSRLMDIWIQLRTSIFSDKRTDVFNMLSFRWWRTSCKKINSISPWSPSAKTSPKVV